MKDKENSQWEPEESSEELQALPREPSEAEEGSDPLTLEEMAMLRAGVAQSGEDRSQLPPHDTSDRAHVMRFARKNKLVTAAVIVIVLALVAGLVLGGIGIASYLNSLPNKSDYTVYLGENDPYMMKYAHAVGDDGVLYIDMVKIAEFTDAMIISGTKTNRKFTASGGTSLRFEENSEIARINGKRVEMWVEPVHGGEAVLAKARVNATECWVPYSFLAQTVEEGMIFRMDPKTNTITIKHIHYMQNGDKENATPADILFHLGSFTPLPEIQPPPEYEWVYTIDIEPYLDAITSEDLLLANKRHPLGESFKPAVVDLTCATDGEQQRMQANAAMALYAMMEEMDRAGVTDVFVTSSYRTYANQKWLYYTYYYDIELAKHPDWSDEQIFAEISKYSSRPGESEHQTGLCLDFTAKSIGGQLNNTFAQTDAFRWLSENAYKFGFILRYPEDKVDVTEYSYESWHYRFVGRDAATEMYFNDLCLEEYLGELPE